MLPTKLLTNAMGAATAIAAALSFTSAAQAINLVTNGSFEANEANRVTTTYSGQNKIQGWEVTKNSVDLVDTLWNSFGSDSTEFGNNFNSVDLNGWTQGSISQTVNTVFAQSYNLSFYMGGNYFYFPNLDMQMEVFWGDQSLGIFTHQLGASETWKNFNWDLHEIEVIGTGSDELRFVSLSHDGTATGPLVDLVSVEEKSVETQDVPEPFGVLGTLCAVGFGFVVNRRNSSTEV